MDLGPLIILIIVFISAVVITKLKSIRHTRPKIFWGITLFLCFSILFGANELLRRVIGGFAGSYPFVEYWDLNARESDLIEIINEVKKEHNDLQPPIKSEYPLGRDDYWYFIDFYYSDTKEVVHTWTRSEDEGTTRLAFISLSNSNVSTEPRLINRDFWYLANRREIKKFERTIIDRIKRKIEQRNKSGI